MGRIDNFWAESLRAIDRMPKILVLDDDDREWWTARTHTHVRRYRRTLYSTLERIRGAPKVVASRSYWHPNGFVKLVLDEDDSWGEMRLHVWPVSGTQDDIHSHSWFYRSICLFGVLEEAIYHEVEGGSSMWCHRYGRQDHREFAFVDPELTHLAVESVVTWTRGAESGGSPTHVHRFIPIEAPAATLVHTGPILADSSGVYRDVKDEPQVLKPPPTTEGEVVDLVTLVLERL